jgi:hypothetical protein
VAQGGGGASRAGRAALFAEAVYDYVPGKVDWRVHGLATEGEKAGEPRAGDVVRDDVVRAGLQERMGALRRRVDDSPYAFAFVVSDAGCLLGRLRKTALQALATPPLKT